MNKYSLGDLVSYSNKNLKINNLEGEIIAFRRYTARAIEAFIVPTSTFVYSRWGILNTYSIHPENLMSYLADEYQQVVSSDAIRPKRRGLWISIGSRNLKPLWKPYDPKQEPWEEGDI